MSFDYDPTLCWIANKDKTSEKPILHPRDLQFLYGPTCFCKDLVDLSLLRSQYLLPDVSHLVSSYLHDGACFVFLQQYNQTHALLNVGCRENSFDPLQMEWTRNVVFCGVDKTRTSALVKYLLYCNNHLFSNGRQLRLGMWMVNCFKAQMDLIFVDLASPPSHLDRVEKILPVEARAEFKAVFACLCAICDLSLSIG